MNSKILKSQKAYLPKKKKPKITSKCTSILRITEWVMKIGDNVWKQVKTRIYKFEIDQNHLNSTLTELTKSK